MKWSFVWEALTILFVGFCLFRILGKKAVGQMTGLEIITLLAMASHIGHAIPGDDSLVKSIVVLCVFVALLLAVQFLAIRFDFVEKLFVGKATVVIRDGAPIADALKKLRLSVDQLEAKLREVGIASFKDVKVATIEISGQIGYELMRHAKPVTIGELERWLGPLGSAEGRPKQKAGNLFDETVRSGHDKAVPDKLE